MVLLCSDDSRAQVVFRSDSFWPMATTSKSKQRKPQEAPVTSPDAFPISPAPTTTSSATLALNPKTIAAAAIEAQTLW
jgi:hypothetical protein